MRPLRIGVNALYLIPGGVGGTEIYLRSLLRTIGSLKTQHRFCVFVNAETGDDLAPHAANFEVVKTGVRATFRPGRLGWEQLGLPGKLRKHGIDVLFNPGFTAPWIAPCPSVTVFHDLQHVRHPEYFRWFDLPFWQAFLFAAARRSERIIAVSEATRRDFLAHYHVDPARVHTVHHGVDPEFFGLRERRTASPSYPYILAVSTLHPHKNFQRLLTAYAKFAQRHPDVKLTIAGLRGFDADRIDRQIAQLGLADKVECTGWIPRDRLYDLFAGATAFIYPTTFEGFGMPLLEGMAAGLPVACSNIEPLRTLAGDAVYQFDPLQSGEIETALERIVEDDSLRSGLRDAGPKRARDFSWEETARATVEILEQAALQRR